MQKSISETAVRLRHRKEAAVTTQQGRLRTRLRRLAGLTAAAFLALPVASLPASAASPSPSNAPVVGIAATPDGQGYWEVASDGGVFSFGDARFYGSMGGKPLNAAGRRHRRDPRRPGLLARRLRRRRLQLRRRPVLRVDGRQAPQRSRSSASPRPPTATATGWSPPTAASSASATPGSTGRWAASPSTQPVVGIAATPDGQGYWVVASDGGVFTFGDARFYGSMGGKSLNNPVTSIAATPDGHGYWLAAADGGVFAFGDAGFHGSMGSSHLAASVNTIASAPGGGYWLAAVDGGVFAFGTANFYGRASYSPPAPLASSTGQLAANLASGWVGFNYTGVGNDYWHATYSPQYWCSDFATYVWQHAGIAVPTYPGVSSFRSWAQQHGRLSSDLSHLQVGDVVFYAQHVGVIVQVNADGSITTADGDFGGSGSSEAAFASSSRVRLNVFNPGHGQGAAGAITGIGLIG